MESFSFDKRRDLLIPSNLPRMVGQCYKWASYLARYSIRNRVFDQRPFQMWKILGLCRDRTFRINSNTLRLPSYSSRRLLQDEFFPDKSNPPCDFSAFLYFFAITHLSRTKFTFPRKRKGDSQKLAAPFAVVSAVITNIVRAWSSFARSIGFDNVHCMIYPYFCIDSGTGEMFLLPDPSRLLPSPYRYKIMVAEKPQSASQPTAAADRDNVNVGLNDNDNGNDNDNADNNNGTASSPPPLGVPLHSDDAPVLFRHISVEAHHHLRTFAKDFFDDITRVVSDTTIYTLQDDDSGQPSLPLFRSDNVGSLPPRFSYSNPMLDLVRRAANFARVAAISVDNDSPARRQARAQRRFRQQTLSLTPRASAPPTPQHTCTTDCDCAALRAKIVQELFLHCSFAHSDFNNVIDVLDSECEVHLEDGSVQFILTDPPYNVRRERGRFNADHDQLSKKDCKEFAHLVYRLLKPGGHMVLFCSALQFSTWHKIFTTYTGPPPSTTHVFTVTAVPLLFIPQRNVYPQKPFRRSLLHNNVAELALHLARIPQRYSEAFNQVQWQNHGYVHSTFPAYTNIVNNIPALSNRERLHTSPLSTAPATTASAAAASAAAPGPSSSNRAKLRPEQKSVALCRELISRYSKPGDIVFDPFAGTFSYRLRLASLFPARRRFLRPRKGRKMRTGR